MDYQSYRIQSFDKDSTEGEEGQLQVRPAGGDFETGHPPGGEGEPAGFEQEAPEVEEASGQTDFASIKFQRENTLLTNAERYSDSVREEAELYVRQLRSEIEALNEQADQRYEEARLVKEQAEAEAKQLIEDAERNVDEVRQQGFNEGFEQGRIEGLHKRYEEAGPHLANIEEILEDLSRFREQVNYYAEKDSVRLALLMAKRIVLQELKINKQVVWKILAASLEKLSGTGVFHVWLNPGDFEFATAARPALEKFMDEDQTLIFRARSDLMPGNAMIETDREVIDLTFLSQFRHLDRVLDQALAEREAKVMNLPPEVSPAMEQEPLPQPAAASPVDQIDPPQSAEAGMPDAAVADSTPESLAAAAAAIVEESTQEIPEAGELETEAPSSPEEIHE
ncbi:MAG: FliH/SctL family protein [SAR324 cluster bacterium]|nr:FliH/SctL family protein [SAR324 cluster bacterium]